MSAIEELIKTLRTLLSPGGCEWDKAQTLMSMRTCLLEETCEVIDAIESGDAPHIKEELGDLLFNALFLSLLAEKEKYATSQEIAQALNEKLIYRHPHVFGEVDQIATPEGVVEQWDRLKTKEKGKETRQSSLDGIPKSLPTLARAQKVLKKMQKKGFSLDQTEDSSKEYTLGKAFLKLIADAQSQSIEAEFALRNVLEKHEAAFRAYEQENNHVSMEQ